MGERKGRRVSYVENDHCCTDLCSVVCADRVAYVRTHQRNGREKRKTHVVKWFVFVSVF